METLNEKMKTETETKAMQKTFIYEHFKYGFLDQVSV